jgi:hypothetical protein
MPNMRTYQLAAAVALGVVAGPAQAAPLPVWTSAELAGQMTSAIMADIIRVADRRCAWRNGRRHCRRLAGPAWPTPGYGYKAGGSDYYEQDARTLPVGSQRWWDIKDREGSTGRP